MRRLYDHAKTDAGKMAADETGAGKTATDETSPGKTGIGKRDGGRLQVRQVHIEEL